MKIWTIATLLGLLLVGLGYSWGGYAKIWQISDSEHIEFMKAVHQGNYEKAKEIADKYGIGGKFIQNEELFKLRYQMQQKINSGDYAGALQIKKQMMQNEDFQKRLPRRGFGAENCIIR